MEHILFQVYVFASKPRNSYFMINMNFYGTEEKRSFKVSRRLNCHYMQLNFKMISSKMELSLVQTCSCLSFVIILYYKIMIPKQKDLFTCDSNFGISSKSHQLYTLIFVNVEKSAWEELLRQKNIDIDFYYSLTSSHIYNYNCQYFPT